MQNDVRRLCCVLRMGEKNSHQHFLLSSFFFFYFKAGKKVVFFFFDIFSSTTSSSQFSVKLAAQSDHCNQTMHTS